MKRFKIIALAILLTAGLAACSTNKAPIEDLEEQAQNGEGDEVTPGVDANNSNEVITDNKNDAAEQVNDEDANDLDKEDDDFEYTEDGLISPEDAQKTIQDTSDRVIMALKNKDMEALSTLIHPEQGVRFTLYSFVHLDTDVVFNNENIKNFFNDTIAYIWGYFDGSGDPVKMTPAVYFDKFIYNQDFLNAEQIGYNTVLSGGNVLNNQFEVYTNPIIVEYYFPGFEPEMEGLDWQSLSLVFEKHTDGNWYLVGIINNRNTV